MVQYAYIRVSTKEQNIDRQILALEPYHIPSENIYCDYQSGKDFERPEYRKLTRKLREGDLLIVKSIDRLGRNYNDILIEWQYITKKIKADILVLDMELLDTRQKSGNLTGTLIADLVLQIFAYVAQTEREFICQIHLKKFASYVRKEKYPQERRLKYWGLVIRHFTGNIKNIETKMNQIVDILKHLYESMKTRKNLCFMLLF